MIHQAIDTVEGGLIEKSAQTGIGVPILALLAIVIAAIAYKLTSKIIYAIFSLLIIVIIGAAAKYAGLI